MIIQCPRCSTRWRVPSQAPVENPAFKCGRCHHLFRQFPGAPTRTDPKIASGRTHPASPEADNLEFIFPAHASEPTEEVAGEHTVGEPGDTQPEPGTPGEDEPTVHQIGAQQPDRGRAITLEREGSAPERSGDVRVPPTEFALTPEDEEKLIVDEWRDQPVAAGLAASFADDFDDGDTTLDGGGPFWPTPERVLHVAPPVTVPSAFGAIVRVVVALVAAHALLALLIRVAPDHASAWLARLPVVGASFAQERVLTRKVVLRNVLGGYQRLRNGRRVFVISGEALNNSGSAVERIEVEGALYDLGGEVDQKVVSAGNRTTVTDLSEAEIAFLQGLEPRTTLAPGEATPFLIVFLEPPQDLREFSSRVLSVRPTRRAALPRPVERVPRPASLG